MACRIGFYARIRASRSLAASLLLTAAAGCTIVLDDLPPRVQEKGDSGPFAPDDEDAGDPDDAAVEGLPDAADGTFDAEALDAGSEPDADERDADVADAADESCDSAVAWYADEDGDGFGTGEARVACPKPSGKWAKEQGDCQDQDKRVFPRQARYFGAPYVGVDGNDSYDYDCSGLEDGNPKQSSLGGGCGLLSLLACQGTGYGRTNRTGLFVNPVCGSLVVETCDAKVLNLLACGSTSQTVTDPYLCH